MLEYVASDGGREVAGVFRLTAEGDDTHRYLPRGLRANERYRIRGDSSGDAFEVSGHELQRDGLEVRLERRLTSELSLIESN